MASTYFYKWLSDFPNYNLGIGIPLLAYAEAC